MILGTEEGKFLRVFNTFRFFLQYTLFTGEENQAIEGLDRGLKVELGDGILAAALALVRTPLEIAGRGNDVVRPNLKYVN